MNIKYEETERGDKIITVGFSVTVPNEEVAYQIIKEVKETLQKNAPN